MLLSMWQQLPVGLYHALILLILLVIVILSYVPYYTGSIRTTNPGVALLAACEIYAA